MDSETPMSHFEMHKSLKQSSNASTFPAPMDGVSQAYASVVESSEEILLAS